MIGADPAYMAFLLRSRSPVPPDSADDSDSSAIPPRNTTAFRNIVVVCDGTHRGDNAPQLAAEIARSTASAVRAVTWLTPAVARSAADMDRAPIEDLLDRVTQQLYRSTRNPGFWRLMLVTGDFVPSVSRAARGESADLVIVPGDTHASPEMMADIARATGAPVAQVFGRVAHADYHVSITAVHSSTSQRLARLAASIISVIFRRQSGADPSIAAPVEIYTPSALHSTRDTGLDDTDLPVVS